MPGGQVGSGGAHAVLRAYRSAALSTGAAGVLTHVPWDALSASLDPVNLGISGGDITVDVGGMVCVQCKLTANGLALLTGFRIAITRSPGTAREFVADDSIYKQVATVGSFSLPVCARFGVEQGDTIRVTAAPVGVGAVAYVVGEPTMWCGVTVV